MNKADLIQKVKAIDGLGQDERAYLINLINTKKKYGLVWEDKLEDVEELLRENLPILKEVKEKAIINGDGNPNHIIIEGDNLHALTALTFTHEGKFDVLYFDPPYNTGSKDFIYNDTFVDKEDNFRHSKWLSFMYKRLQLAKILLNENGIILISIDDNEAAQLKLLCDEVFIESNFIAEFIHKNNSNKNQAKLVGISTEYMYCYAKNKENLKGVEWKMEKKGAKDVALAFSKMKKSGLSLEEIESEIKLMYKRPKYSHLSRWNKVNENGVFKDADLSREGGAKDYTIVNPNTGKPCTIPSRGWGKSYDELIRLQKANLIWYGEPDTPPGLIDYITTDDLMVPDSFLYFDNSVDTKWQKDVFGKLIFENPKPLDMIRMLLNFQPNKSINVLDIFAGSGTTLHAVMQQNEDDGGFRSCVLVSNNENNICEEITYERNKRVIQGYTNAKGQVVKGLSRNNLRYYKNEYLSRDPSLKNKRKLTQMATELLCIKENCFAEQKLNIKQAKLFSCEQLSLLILFDDNVIPDAVEFIKSLDVKTVKVYVFSVGSDPYTEDFSEVLHKVTLCALPDAIYKAYQNVLPKKKRNTILMDEGSENTTNENGEQLTLI